MIRTEQELAAFLAKRGGAKLAPERPQKDPCLKECSDMVYGEIRSHGASERPNTANIYLPITPVSKPRMTQRDKWKKRPCVLRYRDYCDALRAAWPRLADGHQQPFPSHGYHAIFHLPMPKSWSKKKKAQMNGQPHQQKPDKDNLEKALLDALCADDSYIYDGRVSKYWADAGYIQIYLNQEVRKAA